MLFRLASLILHCFENNRQEVVILACKQLPLCSLQVSVLWLWPCGRRDPACVQLGSGEFSPNLQLWVSVGHSLSPRSTWIYLLLHLLPYLEKTLHPAVLTDCLVSVLISGKICLNIPPHQVSGSHC